MTEQRLRELIAGGESLTVEFKGEETRQVSDDELVELVVCLANRPQEDRAWLLLGVEDDGRITGARPRHGETVDPLRLQALIANRTRPSLSCRVETVTVEGKLVVVVEVPRALAPVGTASGVYKRRAIGGRGIPECLPYHFHEMQSLQASRGLLDYSALVVPEACWDDLDPLEFERFRRFIREYHGDTSLVNLPDSELAKALGAIDANHEVRAIRVLGLLLFGKEDAIKQFIPAHEVAFQVLSGTEVLVNDFFRWPLLRVMEECLTRFRARNQEQELMVGLLRVGVPDYPERAFREGLANALIHRDYTRLGAVHVQWQDNQLVISNPGGFPEGVRLDNLLVTPPKPRNLRLAEAFKRAGVVERTARGIDTIFYEQLRNGRPAPSYERSTETDVVLVLPGGKANLDFVRLVVEESQSGHPLGLDELLILNCLWQERRLTTQEAARLIQKPETEARAVMEQLVERGLVEARGERKGRAYHFSPSTYQRLGLEAEYVRLRGFEPLQMEQMILQYVQKFGSISRAKAAALCRIREHQAYYLLQKLVRKGKLLKRGQGRSAHYVGKTENA